jgi:hypothetical protein
MVNITLSTLKSRLNTPGQENRKFAGLQPQWSLTVCTWTQLNVFQELTFRRLIRSTRATRPASLMAVIIRSEFPKYAINI